MEYEIFYFNLNLIYLKTILFLSIRCLEDGSGKGGFHPDALYTKRSKKLKKLHEELKNEAKDQIKYHEQQIEKHKEQIKKYLDHIRDYDRFE